MRVLPRAGFLVLFLGVLGIGLVLWATSREAEARPQYFASFKEKYSGVELPTTSEKCNVCHVAKKAKKMRNVYGQAVAEAINGKDVKDKAQITKALETAAGKESQVKGKTFGQLLEEGKWPDSKE